MIPTDLPLCIPPLLVGSSIKKNTVVYHTIPQVILVITLLELYFIMRYSYVFLSFTVLAVTIVAAQQCVKVGRGGGGGGGGVDDN